MACRTDPALNVIAAVSGALADQFADGPCPPMVGATENVRLFAGDGAPLAAWDSHASGGGCSEPFVWVRAMRRYRSKQFPTATIDTSPCGLTRVISVELGVGWCAEVGEPDRPPSWEAYEREAQVSMDTAWRLENAMCASTKRLTADAEGRLVGSDILVPYGPEGGVIAWSGVIYSSY